MSIQVRASQSEEEILLEKPRFSVKEEYNGKFVDTTFTLNDQEFSLLFTKMITFNRKSPTYGFSLSPDRDEPKEEFIKTMKMFDKLGKSFKKKSFYSTRTYVPLYSEGAQYPFNIHVSYGDEFDFKVGDGPVEIITFNTRQKVLNLMGPSSEGQQQITNLNCEVKLGINSFKSSTTGQTGYRFKLVMTKLHIIPYKKPEPTMFTLTLDDSDDEKEPSSDEDKPNDSDSSEEPQLEPEEVEL